MMRQPAVTARTRLVPRIRRHLLHARLVTHRASIRDRHAAQRKLECVRLVTADARRVAVRAIGSRELVTRAASADLYGRGNSAGMRVVAAHTVARLLGMVGVHGLVARRTGGRGARPHVVRRMAVGAAVVRRDLAAADHVHLRMAAAAGRGLFFLELVRLVTANALRVPARKQRRGRDDWLLHGVTGGARADRLRRWRVSLRVAGRTGFDERFPVCGVTGRNVLVAVGARRRLRRPLVRLVTAEAGLCAVHRNRGERPLLYPVTALAIAGLEAFDAQHGLARASIDHDAGRLFQQRFFVARPFQREGMTSGAHGLRVGTKALAGFRRRMLDMPLFLVARRAAFRRHGAHFVFSRSVAIRARDFQLLHVNAVTRDVTRKTPGFVDVNAGAPSSILERCLLAGLRRIFLVGTGSEREKHEHWDQHPCRHWLPLFHSRPS